MDDPTLAPTTIMNASPIDVARAGWLHAHSRSVKTHTAYRAALDAYRASLQERGLDLDSDVLTLALAAQAYAAHTSNPRKGRASKRTINQRLAALSSFFQYAMK